MSETTAVFLYGTLCDPELLSIVAGSHIPVRGARLVDHRVAWAEGETFPMIVADEGGEVHGLVAQLSPGERERIDFYELGFGFRPEPVGADTDSGRVAALAYMPVAGRWTPGAPWSLPDWQKRHGKLTRAAAADYMALRAMKSPFEAAAIFPQVQSRAYSRLRAEALPSPSMLGQEMSAAGVALHRTSQPYVDYFAVREDELSYPRFDGGWSPRVKRVSFMGGDAVTVLPFDPATGSVLVVRQFRHGPFARGDGNPWTLEPVAGRIDAGEGAIEAAHRELAEETGIVAKRLHEIAGYYPTPAAFSEFLTSFVAIADLGGADGRVSGVEDEAEDILSLVLPLEELLDLVASGAANTGPLVLSALWLDRNRERLAPTH